MNKIVSISTAAKALGVSTSTLRRWEASDRLVSGRTEGGQRRYDLAALRPGFHHGAPAPRQTIAYARVSSHDQKADLGSGMNYHKKGLKRLLDAILEGDVGRLVLTHKDRLLRFGAELVFALCEARQVEVVIINQGQETSFEEELAGDMLEILTVFSARLYGSRSQRNQKLIEGIQDVVKEAQCS